MSTKAKKLAKYSEFQEILGKELPINAARVKFIVLLISSLIKVQSVNYERLAQGFDNPVALSSNLRRIQRFFACFSLDADLIARLLFKLLPSKSAYGLTLDRTNWKFGQKNINILFIGVIHKGMSLPLLWVFLGNKRGNSDQQERIVLLQRYIKLFGAHTIEFITADREFIGEQWWQFLIINQIRFCIRLRENMHLHIPGKGIVKAFWLFYSLPLNTAYHYPKIVQVNNNWVYLSGLKYVNKKGRIEYLIVACFEKNYQTLEYYAQRWQIESMFKALKSAGFNLEDTHLTDYERLDKLLMIIALTFMWAYKVGIYKNDAIRPLKIKKHGRLEMSFFAYGLKWLAQVFINSFTSFIPKLTLAFLSCT